MTANEEFGSDYDVVKGMCLSLKERFHFDGIVIVATKTVNGETAIMYHNGGNYHACIGVVEEYMEIQRNEMMKRCGEDDDEQDGR